MLHNDFASLNFFSDESRSDPYMCSFSPIIPFFLYLLRKRYTNLDIFLCTQNLDLSVNNTLYENDAGWSTYLRANSRRAFLCLDMMRGRTRARRRKIPAARNIRWIDMGDTIMTSTTWLLNSVPNMRGLAVTSRRTRLFKAGLTFFGRPGCFLDTPLRKTSADIVVHVHDCTYDVDLFENINQLFLINK